VTLPSLDESERYLLLELDERGDRDIAADWIRLHHAAEMLNVYYSITPLRT
jgi:hypothetical protein